MPRAEGCTRTHSGLCFFHLHKAQSRPYHTDDAWLAPVHLGYFLMHTGKGDAMRYATKHIIRSLLDANCKPRLCVIIQHHGDDILHKLRHTQVLKHEARRAKERSSHRHQRVSLTSCDHKRLDRITIPSLHHFVVCIRRFATAAGHRHGRSLRKRWRFNAGRAP